MTSYARYKHRREMLYDDPVDAAVYSLNKDRTSPDLTRTVSHIARTSPPLAVYAIFHGHGAATAAELCARNFVPTLLDDPALPAQPERALANALQALEAFVLAKSAIDRAYYGTTALIALVQGPTLYIANLGNSRAVLSSRDGARTLTDDHSAANPQEVARVEQAGAFFHDGKVNNLVRVTRSIGDLELKNRKHITFPQLTFSADVLIARPDIYIRPLRARDHFVLLATPHVWERLTDIDAAGIVRDALRRRETPRTAAKKLAAAAAAAGARGTVTVMVLVLAPNLAPEGSNHTTTKTTTATGIASVSTNGNSNSVTGATVLSTHHKPDGVAGHQLIHNQLGHVRHAMTPREKSVAHVTSQRRRAARSPSLKRHSSNAEQELRSRTRSPTISPPLPGLLTMGANQATTVTTTNSKTNNHNNINKNFPNKPWSFVGADNDPSKNNNTNSHNVDKGRGRLSPLLAARCLMPVPLSPPRSSPSTPTTMTTTPSTNSPARTSPTHALLDGQSRSSPFLSVSQESIPVARRPSTPGAGLMRHQQQDYQQHVMYQHHNSFGANARTTPFGPLDVPPTADSGGDTRHRGGGSWTRDGDTVLVAESRSQEIDEVRSNSLKKKRRGIGVGSGSPPPGGRGVDLGSGQGSLTDALADLAVEDMDKDTGKKEHEDTQEEEGEPNGGSIVGRSGSLLDGLEPASGSDTGMIDGGSSAETDSPPSRREEMILRRNAMELDVSKLADIEPGGRKTEDNDKTSDEIHGRIRPIEREMRGADIENDIAGKADVTGDALQSGGAAVLSVLSDVTASGVTGGETSLASVGMEEAGRNPGVGARVDGSGGGAGAMGGVRLGASMQDYTQNGPSKVRYRDDGTVQHGALGFLRDLGRTFVRRK